MEKKLNILFLCSWYPNPDEKSNGIFIKRHAQALALKHTVTVVFVKSVAAVNKAVMITNETQNFKEYLWFYPKIETKTPLLGSVLKFLKFKMAYKTAIDKLSGSTFDVIHVNTIFPAAIPALYALKKYPSAKLVITEHWSGYYPEDGNYKGNLITYYTKQLVARAKAIFVISEKLKHSMRAHGLKNNYELVNNVVDTTVFKPMTTKVGNNTILNILHVSSLVDREKNISGIIAVAHELKQKNKAFHLTIVGENKTEMPLYLSLVKQYNLMNEISFEGFKTGEEIVIYMNQAEVFLLLSHYEGMPVVILESLACGLPVIATPVGEIKNSVNQGMGIVLQNNKINECVEQLVNYKRSHFLEPHLMHEYIRDHYSPEAVCEHITKLYNTY